MFIVSGHSIISGKCDLVTWGNWVWFMHRCGYSSYEDKYGNLIFRKGE